MDRNRKIGRESDMGVCGRERQKVRLETETV